MKKKRISQKIDSRNTVEGAIELSKTTKGTWENLASKGQKDIWDSAKKSTGNNYIFN